ncbi:hypothetical protein Pmani_033064 [Petrolisthes manimaculis]|uniref:Uncharacterized protein n=1 Tax=Petrolisthes manimaculis TaxID=1843537 RepID=A0AAE1NSK7_9EUCA|nr:hypothetical protein Pmani_033064 [Petrolisthes manimaculis]
MRHRRRVCVKKNNEQRAIPLIIHHQQQQHQHQYHHHKHHLGSDTYRIRRPLEDGVVVAERKITPSDLPRNGRQFMHSVSLGETLAGGGQRGNQTTPKSNKNHYLFCSYSFISPRHTSSHTVALSSSSFSSSRSSLDQRHSCCCTSSQLSLYSVVV